MRTSFRLSEALAAVAAGRWAHQATGDQAISRAERCVRFLGDKAARRVTRADLGRMLAAMHATGLSPASCNRHLSALSAVLEEAGVTIPLPWQREPKGRTRWLTHDEVRLLALACARRRHGPAVASLVQFLAETGVRVGEALALRWEDVDVLARRLTVRRSKNGDTRAVPLTAVALENLPKGRPNGPWAGLSQSTVNHVFRAAREDVESTRGDREVVVHTLRHTAASRLVRAGVSLPVVSAWLGHRDHRSTLRYVHVDDAGLHAAARMLEDAR
jgi:integrase